MSHLSLSPNCAFGLRSDIRHGAHFLEEGTVVFPVGHNVVVHHLESKTQRFIPGLAESDGISAVAISGNRRYCAIAEKSDNAPVIIFDLTTLKRRKALISVEAGSQEIVSLSFSRDSKILVAQGGSPDWTLCVWSWEKAKLVASIKTTNNAAQPVDQCLFGAHVCVIGPRLFKQFRLTESSLKQQPHILSKQDGYEYRCMEWLDDALVVGCGQGEILMCEGSEISWSHKLASGESVESISRTNNGFVAGTEDGNVIYFEKDSKEVFTFKKTVSLQTQSITHMTISPTGEHLLCTTEDGQVTTLSLSIN